MVHNTMGNYLELTGKGAREVMEKILIPDPECDNPADKVVDFSKIIPVDNQESYDECYEKWGVIRNASNTQYYYEGEGNPPSKANVIYFDTPEPVPKVIAELAKQNPDLHIFYEHCDEDATMAGMRVYEHGEEIDSCIYEYRGHSMMSAFFTMWGREDEFEWNAEKEKYEKVQEAVAE